jgi:hypothetical protein
MRVLKHTIYNLFFFIKDTKNTWCEPSFWMHVRKKRRSKMLLSLKYHFINYRRNFKLFFHNDCFVPYDNAFSLN